MPESWLRLAADDTTWHIDADFLSSRWTCIWNAGCAGIEDTVDVDAQLGCCSVGAQMLDDEEAMLISALGASLDPVHTQFSDEMASGGVLSSDRSNTRVVDGACIFLNRPGFAGGAGCALHAEANRSGESYIDWKPSICWQLPVKIERQEYEDGSSTATLRRWQRADWGVDGATMAYCCTETGSAEGADAYIGSSPVIDSLRPELEALLGHEVVVEIAKRLT